MLLSLQELFIVTAFGHEFYWFLHELHLFLTSAILSMLGCFVFHINRMENSVLGNALEGVPEESEEEEQPSSSNVESPDNLDRQYLGAADFFFLSAQIILACVVRLYVMKDGT